jgi:hypothetical protein
VIVAAEGDWRGKAFLFPLFFVYSWVGFLLLTRYAWVEGGGMNRIPSGVWCVVFFCMFDSVTHILCQKAWHCM